VALHTDTQEAIDSFTIPDWSEEFYGWCSEEDSNRLLELIFATKGASLAGCRELCAKMRDLIEDSVYDTVHERLKGK